MKRPSETTGQDLVALVLTLLVGLSVLVLAIGAVSRAREVITPTEGELLAAIVGASIGAVATYLGRRRGDDEPPQ